MDLPHLKRSRGVRKGAINKIIEQLVQDVTDQKYTEVSDGLMLLQSKEESFLSVLDQIETLTPLAEVDAEMDEHEKLRDKIVLTKIRANRFLSDARATPTTTSVPNMGANTSSNYRQMTAKLPKLHIAPFSGELQDWERFIDQFHAGVESNTQLPPVDKFNYLKGMLVDDAARTIQGLKLTDVNYCIALDLLKKKYGKPEVLKNEHINSLLRLSPVKMTKDGKDLRRLIEEVKFHSRSLEALGLDLMQMSEMLGPVILQTLPNSILSEWNRDVRSQGNYSIKFLVEFVEKELENIEKVFRIAQNRVEASKEEKINRKWETNRYSQQEGLNSASTLVTSSVKSKSGERSGPFCVFCESESHASTGCSQNQTVFERRNALKRNRRCFRCTGRFHGIKTCNKTMVCRICQQNHNTLLCNNKEFQVNDRPERFKASDREDKTRQASKKKEEVNSLITAASCHARSSFSTLDNISVLQVLRVWLQVGNVQEQVIALIDGGSERSFIRKHVVEKFKLPVLETEKLTVHSFGNNQQSHVSNRIPITISGNNGRRLSLDALQVHEICSGVKIWESSQIENFLKSRRSRDWNQLMGKGESVTIDILIGADWLWRLLTGNMKKISAHLMATESIFGWLLQGSTRAYNASNTMVAMLTSVSRSKDEILEDQIKNLWELDCAGIMAKEEKAVMTLEDLEVLEKFENTTEFQDGRYEVEIPWSERKSEICNNYYMSKERLKRLILKLQKTPSLLQRYKEGIYEYLANGHTEEVQDTEDELQSVYYLPHHPVIKEERKTTKLRIVFDGSSKSENGLSLNECQHVGPSLNPLIHSLLIRFRWNKVAFTSDIQKAFLQVRLKEKERNFTRFLWTDEVWTLEKEPPIKIFRMNRVLFGMKSSPFLLAAAIRYHTKNHPETDEEIRKVIDDSTYVDDMLGGAGSTEKSYSLANRIHNFMEKGGFPLKKWATNDNQLRDLWKKDGIVAEDEPMELLKILGLMWNPQTDVLTLKNSIKVEELDLKGTTKRKILEVIARVYDPLGFITPKTTVAKIILQDLWRSKSKWDDKLPDDIQKRWEDWVKDLINLDKIEVNRWLQTGVNLEDLEDTQLHLFSDASPKSYGAVAYVRVAKGQGMHSTSFVTAKARVAPLQLMSIPRLELMACLLASRLAISIIRAWEIKGLKVYFWSDSRVALEWLKGSPSRWKVFVARRVQEIQEFEEDHTWNYCRRKYNVADKLTRGQTIKQLTADQEWWYGPTWLLEDESKWPEELVVQDQESLKGLTEEENVSETRVQLLTISEEPFTALNFSSWRKIIRITAWILRFVKNTRKTTVCKDRFLRIQELKDSEEIWFKRIQKKEFLEELQDLQKNSKVKNRSVLLRLNPFLHEDGLLRMRGRLRFADISEEERIPVILRYNELVKLFILYCHEKVLHGGVQATLIQIRKTVWLLKGRQSVRKALKNCYICRKWEAKPIQVIEAPLPKDRVRKSKPFFCCGIDYAGPVWIKEQNTRKKSYICIFTCAVTRALHLELVTSQGVKHFLMALRRFWSRRGVSGVIYSDNAQSFHQTDYLLRDAHSLCRHNETQDLAASQGVEWKFIAPQSAWWGGFYERMVGAVKRHLRRVLGASLFDFEEFSTILIEIEAIINERPLVSLTDDADDAECLTPAHFLLGFHGQSFSDILPQITSIPGKNVLRKQWNLRQRLMNSFWSKWTQEYLLQLKSANLVQGVNQDRIMKLDDVVLIKDEKLPRGSWKLGRVVELTTGRDGEIRSAVMKLSNGNLVRRALQRVCPLEVC